MIKWAEPAVSLCMFEKVLRRVRTTTRAHPTVSEPTWNVILEAVAVQQTVKVMQESTMVAHEDVDIHPLWVTGRRCINKAAMWTVNCTANMIKQCKTKGFEYLISLIDHWIKSYLLNTLMKTELFYATWTCSFWIVPVTFGLKIINI